MLHEVFGKARLRWLRGSSGNRGGKAPSKEKGCDGATTAEGIARGAAEAEQAAQIVQAFPICSSAKSTPG